MDDSIKNLLWFALLPFSIQWITYIPSAILETEIFFDVTGLLSFFILACTSLGVGGFLYERQVFVTTLVCVWSVRLGTFLLMRIARTGKDCRFDEIRNDRIKLFFIWNIQAFWIFVVSLPLILLNLNSNNPKFLSFYDFIGIILWSVGIVIETIADYQKFIFKDKYDEENKWIDSGLWKYSQHPNYFGEILTWIGIFFLCLSVFSSWQIIAGLASPLFTMFMLVFVSGIPLLDKMAEKKWGSDLQFQKYKRTTPKLIPFSNLLFKRTHSD